MTTIFILILIAIGFIWFSYFRSKSVFEQSVTVPGNQADIRADIVQLRRIRNLKLDTTIFDDRFFQLLQSSPEPPVSPAGAGEIVGRANPFTPF